MSGAATLGARSYQDYKQLGSLHASTHVCSVASTFTRGGASHAFRINRQRLIEFRNADGTGSGWDS